jgi:hypothetical protein
MYYRIASRADTLSLWRWKSTVLSSLETLFQFLRRYGAPQMDSLWVFSSSSRKGLQEQLLQQNQGVDFPAVTAAHFLHERRIQTPGMTPGIAIGDGKALDKATSIAVATVPSQNGVHGQATDLIGKSLSALEHRRLELELGSGGDHDVPYRFALPVELLPVLAWMRILVRIEQGQLQP